MVLTCLRVLGFRQRTCLLRINIIKAGLERWALLIQLLGNQLRNERQQNTESPE